MAAEGPPAGIPPKDWETAKAEARAVMVQRARRDDPIAYSALAAQIHAISIAAHGSPMAELLGQIGTEEDEAGRGILTAIVVHKNGEMKPGPGFFSLASERGRPVADIDKCWIDELRRISDYWKAASSVTTRAPRDFEKLQVQIADYAGSHPFSKGVNPAFYRPEQLRDKAEGNTARTLFFEKVLVGIYWAIARPVPYAFLTKDGEVRSLDAGCMKFLRNRHEPGIEFVCDQQGVIIAVQPTARLLSTYAPMRSTLVASVGGEAPLELPFDLAAPVDERRREISEQVVREGAGAFRQCILAAWGGRCAITGTGVKVVLEAVHIHPYLGPKTNDPRNGIALRSDIHTLFDAFLLTFEPAADALVVRLSRSLQGTLYRKLHGKTLRVVAEQNRPDTRVIQYHLEKFLEAERGRS